ncbi:MAG TPA: hypothetical protein VFP72_00555, partial [Kineosporiaceae bacterium]|nr:hypothetical protein [Kineosporiaceae bacterium]
LHIASAQGSMADGSMTLTVDEHARDLVTIAGILTRNRENNTDPARLPLRGHRKSRQLRDTVVEFDGESAAGVIPRHALFGGLWTVIRVPVSQAGRIAKVTAKTTGPMSPFCLAFFGDAVTPADLIAHVGAVPLTSRVDGYGPFDWDADALTELGFLQAIGGPGQAAGYDPGYETSPHTGSSTPLTGILNSEAGWDYQSSFPPWLWVAEWALDSCYIEGRVWPAPPE